MHVVAGECVLQSELFFLQSVEKVFVRVRAVLFLFDEGVERRVFRFQFLDLSLVHWCQSFRLSQCHRCVINHESGALSRAISRLGGSGEPIIEEMRSFPRGRRGVDHFSDER